MKRTVENLKEEMTLTADQMNAVLGGVGGGGAGGGGLPDDEDPDPGPLPPPAN